MAQAHVLLKTDCQGQNSAKPFSKNKLDVARCWRVKKKKKWDVICFVTHLSIHWSLCPGLVSKQDVYWRSAPDLCPHGGSENHGGVTCCSPECDGCEHVSPHFPALGSEIPPSLRHPTCKLDQDPRRIRPYYLANSFPQNCLFGGFRTQCTH